jgi:hypothetical protein
LILSVTTFSAMATGPLRAQNPASELACTVDTPRATFNAFFEATIGEWQVSIRDFDERGANTYSSMQTRRFAWVVSGRYVEEKAFTRTPTGALANIGVMLYSFDDAVAQVRLVSFWPRSPRRWADFAGCIDGEPQRLAGAIVSHRPNEPVRTRRVEVLIESPSRMRWRGFATGEGGREYVAEELEYTRTVSGGPAPTPDR